MSILYCTLLVNLLWTSRVFGGQNKPESSSLDKAPAPVLPLVLIQISNSYLYPIKLEQAVTNNGFLCNGTTFSTILNGGKQILFCPEETSSPHKSDDCLYPKKFEDLQILQCANEPNPFVEKMIIPLENNQMKEFSCKIANKAGKWYKTGYKICVPLPQKIHHIFFRASAWKWKPMSDCSEYRVFEFCYSEETQEILYTDHHLNSPELLFDDRLKNEREKKYEISTDAHESFGNLFTELKTQYDKLQASTTSLYKPQWLVPPEDLSFATWKKAAYHYLNMKPMRTDKLALWNHINYCTRKQAQQMKSQFTIYTSATVLPETSEVEYLDQQIPIPDIWIKLVSRLYTTKYKNGEIADRRSSSLAIVMNNNLNEDSLKQFYQKYCKQDLCKDAFSKKFPNIGDDVRCCFVGLEILNLFDFEYKINGILEIDFSPDDLDKNNPDVIVLH